jgi:hypothetical protein
MSVIHRKSSQLYPKQFGEQEGAYERRTHIETGKESHAK